MCDSRRRDTLRFLGASALLGVAGSSIAMPALAVGNRRELPAGQYKLTRLIERELVDGAMLRIERSWSCQFEEAGRGMRVSGEQLYCNVEAPASLTALAEMEKRRKGTGPLPALLTSSGRFAYPVDEEPVETGKAVEAAVAVLERQLRDQAQLEQARRVLADLASAASKSLSAIPADLFFPDAAQTKLSREIDVGPGLTGRVVVEIASIVRPGSGLLKSTRRQLVAQIGDDERLSREVWTLDPL